MPEQVAQSKYPLIDSDPHAFRVVRYMRPSDYGVMAATTASVPAALMAWHRVTPVSGNLRAASKLGAVIGFAGGFLLAYQRSSMRFFGWTENSREQAKDFAELSQRAREGKPLYGESDLDAHLQGVAYRNSSYSALKLGTLPWFNLVNHPHHGVDPAKYTAKNDE